MTLAIIRKMRYAIHSDEGATFSQRLVDSLQLAGYKTGPIAVARNLTYELDATLYLTMACASG